MKRGTCVICGTTKTQFIKTQKGGSLLNKFINNLLVEMHLPGHNFTGPGTKLNKWYGYGTGFWCTRSLVRIMPGFYISAMHLFNCFFVRTLFVRLFF